MAKLQEDSGKEKIGLEMSALQGDELGKTAELYEQLRRDIVFGRYRPGEKLRPSVLKDSCDTSVSTIREALNRLLADGFVDLLGNRGFFVAEVTKDGLRQTADLRILLESHALKQSFANATTEWEAQIVAAHYKLQRMEETMAAGDTSVVELWKKYDWEFHRALISGCGSQEILKLHSVIFDKYLRYQLRVLTYRGEISAREHKIMRDAALARDSATAIETLHHHIAAGVDHSLSQWPYDENNR